MTLDLFTSQQLSDMHTETGLACASAYQASLKLTNAMGHVEDPASQHYADLRKTRDVAMAIGKELEELLHEIGEEIRRRTAIETQASGE